jgi:hypothetical protein
MSDIQDGQPATPPTAPRPSSGTGTATGTASGTAGAAQAEATRGYVPRPAPGYDDVRYESQEPSGFALGMTLVAAVLMMIGGVLDFFSGLAALIRGQFFVTLPNYAFTVSVHGWGWLHLITGAVVFATGAALLTDHFWARVVGVVVASLSLVMNFVMMPYYPLWAFVVIALDIVVIWALLTPRTRRR